MVPFLSFCLLLILIAEYVAFFTERYKDDMTTKISFFIGVVSFGYFTYSSVIKLLMNQPIIVLENDSIVLKYKKDDHNSKK
jgi:hypothetical protein